jgi:hypothetical protein
LVLGFFCVWSGAAVGEREYTELAGVPKKVYEWLAPHRTRASAW